MAEIVLSVPEVVRDTVQDNHVRRQTGQGEALDGHALFTREKVAQALACSTVAGQ